MWFLRSQRALRRWLIRPVFRRRLVMDVLEQGFPFAEMIADRLTAGHPGRPHFRQQRGTLDAPLTFIMRGDATFGARR